MNYNNELENKFDEIVNFVITAIESTSITVDYHDQIINTSKFNMYINFN